MAQSSLSFLPLFLPVKHPGRKCEHWSSPRGLLSGTGQKMNSNPNYLPKKLFFSVEVNSCHRKGPVSTQPTEELTERRGADLKMEQTPCFKQRKEPFGGINNRH